MLTRLLRSTWSLPVPWGSWLGLARTLMALGTAGTLAFSDTDAIFAPVLGRDLAPYCDGPRSIGVFCLVPREQLPLLQWLCVAVLLVVASGWLPRWTALPHWWIAFSVSNSIAIPDGGDQAALVLTTLLLPVLLTDRRRWHWQPHSGDESKRSPSAVGVAVVFAWAIRLQVAVLYFHASVAKLGGAEWVDGTAMYYWLDAPSFGAPGWLSPVTDLLTGHQVTLVALTWLPLVVEFALALSLLMRPPARWVLLPLGVGLHLSIALIMGLWSFSLVMFAALILLLVPMGADLQQTRAVVRRWWRRDEPGPAAESSAVSPRTSSPA